MGAEGIDELYESTGSYCRNTKKVQIITSPPKSVRARWLILELYDFGVYQSIIPSAGVMLLEIKTGDGE